MKTLTKSVTVAALAIVTLAGQAFGQVKDYRDIKTPPLRSFTVPQPKRVVLPNGMVLLLMEDRELPIIRGTARIRGGSRDVPAEKAGLVGIYGQAWRTGGTESRTGDQLDEFLESRAAIVETSGGDDSTSISLNVLKNDFDTVLPIFLELLRDPEFRQEKIDLAKTQANTVISRRNDESSTILAREVTKLGYGPDSPYARQTEYATIAAITRDDLLDFHRRYVHPNNIVFGIVGDFETAAMERKLRQAFASWKRGPAAAAVAPTGGTPARPGVYFIAKDDVNQSSIAMVHAGVVRNNPDYAALQVLNEVLNSERLFPRIRTEQGLAYSVFGVVGSDWDHPGLFRAQVGTKSETTAQAIDSLRKELTALHTLPITAEEVNRAKDSILNAHVFTMDSRQKILAQAMNLEFYGYPANWYQRYPDLVRQVSIDDVARVAKKYVQPDQVALLVVGKAADFDKPLSTYGAVTPIDITIPEIRSTAEPAAGNAQGQALIEKVRQFAGGKAKLDAVQAVRSVQSVTRQTPQGEMQIEVDQLLVFPESVRSTMKMPMGEMTMVLTPQSAFMSMGAMGVRDIPSSQVGAMRADVKQDMLTILKFPERYTFAVTGTEKIGDVNAQVLQVSIDGDSANWYVDPATGKVLRKVSQGRSPMEQGQQVTEFTEWKSFDGLMFPTATRTTANGEPVGSSQTKTIEVNPTVDPSAFERPAA